LSRDRGGLSSPLGAGRGQPRTTGPESIGTVKGPPLERRPEITPLTPHSAWGSSEALLERATVTGLPLRRAFIRSRIAAPRNLLSSICRLVGIDLGTWSRGLDLWRNRRVRRAANFPCGADPVFRRFVRSPHSMRRICRCTLGKEGPFNGTGYFEARNAVPSDSSNNRGQSSLLLLRRTSAADSPFSFLSQASPTDLCMGCRPGLTADYPMGRRLHRGPTAVKPGILQLGDPSARHFPAGSFSSHPGLAAAHWQRPASAIRSRRGIKLPQAAIFSPTKGALGAPA